MDTTARLNRSDHSGRHDSTRSYGSGQPESDHYDADNRGRDLARLVGRYPPDS